MKTTLYIVDDHPIMLDGIQIILLNNANYEVVGTSTDVKNALIQLEDLNPEVVITDLNMPGLSGIDLILEIKNTHPHIKIIVLSLHDELHYVKEVLQLGVDGYVLKNETSRDLELALDFAVEGRIFYSRKISELLQENLDKPDSGKLLTDREKQILRLIAAENTNKEIAQQLYISERTVETHRKNIFRKAGTNNLVGLIKFAIANTLAH